MTTLLSIPARPSAPVACDLTGASDTLPERIDEYRRLFDQALIGRESAEDRATFRFTDGPGIADRVVDLVRRETACCPFLSYEVRREHGQVVWTAAGADVAVLDELLAGLRDPRGTR